MKSLVRKWLMGETVFSAYVKITVPGNIQQKVWLKANGTVTDVSGTHWLLCIEPIVFGIWLSKDFLAVSPPEKMSFTLYFGGNLVEAKNHISNAEAIVHLEWQDRVDDGDGSLILLRTRDIMIYQLSLFKRFLIFYRYYKKDGLRFNRFKSFVSAYSYPRRIRVVSFRRGDYYNIFPMDLLGEINKSGRYIFGLRHTNITLSKIIESGQIVVCDVSSTHKDLIYGLGKHHSGNPPPLESLRFKTVSSKNFNFHIPTWVQDYKEIKILKTLNMGSHMLLWGQVVEQTHLDNSQGHLYLVHFLHYLHQKHRGNEYTLA